MLVSISWPISTGFHLGPLTIRPHGVFIAVGFLIGARLMLRHTRRQGLPDDAVWRVLGWSLVAGLVGMRLAWVMGHTHEIEGLLDVLAVWNGGMTLLGGLLTAVPVGVAVARRQGVPVLALLDMAAPAMALGIAIGRVGDLLIGDHLGRPTTLPWGFRYPGSDHALAGAPPVGAVVHPVALYDLVLTALLFLVLLRFRRTTRNGGSAIALFTLWYAGSRLLTDLLRTDPRRLLGLTGTQIASLVLVATVTVALATRETRSRRLAAAAHRSSSAPDRGPARPTRS